ncbi:ferritin-like domain-containing protein [Brumimicrobium mesophilum]|uniref:ferritin-like domain-containing protein n=1 Tax=Brumimicrobium mesophilum TaxID=392717 RepID=UPI000D142059|nr:ferritin-like protein [Brumimicrobium mesophilum]
MINPHKWKKQDFYNHLQHAVDLELWTIPLYMTSLYSIKEIEGLSPIQYSKTAKLILSVINEEMLHLEIACNLCNALGYSPVINPPVYSKDNGIPFLKPNKLPHDLRDYSLQLGPLDVNQLKLFCAIEFPQKVGAEFWENTQEFESIAELYAAISIGVENFWEECFDPENEKQKSNFKGYESKNNSNLGFSQNIDSLENALKGIEAIIEQGEGAEGNSIPDLYRPPILEENQPYHPGWFEGDICHFQKFHLLLKNPEILPVTYKISENSSNGIAQRSLNSCYSNFLNELEISFNTKNNTMTSGFWTSMMELPRKIQQVWASGICPDWNVIR